MPKMRIVVFGCFHVFLQPDDRSGSCRGLGKGP